MIAAVSNFFGISLLATRIAATVALFGTVIAFGYGIIHAHDKNVIAKHDAKIEKATTNATHQIRSAAARSNDDSVRGIRDPSTKD